MIYSVLNLSDLFNPSPTYSYKLHGFTFPSLLCDVCEKHVSYALKIIILITLLLPFDDVICVLSSFRSSKVGMT